MGDAGGATAFDHFVAQLGFGELFGFDSEIEDLGFALAILNGGDGAVAGVTEMGADEFAHAIELDAVVVGGAGLDDVVTESAGGAVQDVPVAEDVGRAVVLVEDDAADGAGGDLCVGDTDAGNDGVDPLFAAGGGGLRDDLVAGFIGPLEDIGGDGDAIDFKRSGDELGFDGRKHFRLGLLVDRELHADFVGHLSVLDFVANADGRDVRIAEIIDAAGADEVFQAFHRRGLVGRGFRGGSFFLSHVGFL